MATISLTDVRKKHREVFDLANVEPVVVTKHGRPSHVVISYSLCQAIAERLEELEDQVLGEKAMVALATQRRVGSERFTETLRRILDDQR